MTGASFGLLEGQKLLYDARGDGALDGAADGFVDGRKVDGM
jgi:hypothetical protein